MQSSIGQSPSVTPASTKYLGVVVAGLLLLAFIVRVAAASYWHGSASEAEHYFRVGDSYSYWTLATHIGQREPYEYGSENAKLFRAPLYPLLLAPFTWIQDASNAVFSARLLGCLLGTVAVGLIGWLARHIAGVGAGIAAIAIGSFYPSAIGMSITVLSEALFMPLFLGHLLVWTKALERENPNWLGVLAGALAGLGILARPSWLLFLPFAFAVLALASNQRVKHLTLLTCSVIGLCLVMSPWWIRNATVTGKFVPTTLQVGPSLYDGLHPGATGYSDEGMLFMRDILAEQLAEDAQSPEKLESTLEWRINKRATKLATSWATENPLAVLKLAVRKFGKTWSVWPDGGENGSWVIRIAITISSFSVLLGAGWGTLLLIRRKEHERTAPVFLLWLPCLYFTLLHMVFVGSVRYREPAVFVLIALAAYAVSHCSTRYFYRPNKRSSAADV